MRELNSEKFFTLAKKARIRDRLRKELRYTTSTNKINQSDWIDLELASVTDRSGDQGVLVLEPDETLYIIPFEITKGITNKRTGRSTPVICDFCKTWQPGGNVGRITFKKDPKSQNSTTYLCCADLDCSRNVRTKTNASLISRAQIHEDLTDDQRVERLKKWLRNFIIEMDLEALA